MQVILVRHGETASNKDRQALGRRDVPLNEAGLSQAKSLARVLAAERASGRAIEAVYASPLLRARQTAEAIAAALGHPVIEAPAFVEMDVGEMDGLATAELRERHPEFMRRWLGPDVGTARMPGGGESLADVQERAWPAVEKLREAHDPEAAVVVVSHNFVIRTLVCRALSMDLSLFRRYEIDLATITRIDFRGPRTLLASINDRCHLETPGFEAGRT
jgi:broad specificity phosphatase PhoE